MLKPYAVGQRVTLARYNPGANAAGMHAGDVDQIEEVRNLGTKRAPQYRYRLGRQIWVDHDGLEVLP